MSADYWRANPPTTLLQKTLFHQDAAGGLSAAETLAI